MTLKTCLAMGVSLILFSECSDKQLFSWPTVAVDSIGTFDSANQWVSIVFPEPISVDSASKIILGDGGVIIYTHLRDGFKPITSRTTYPSPPMAIRQNSPLHYALWELREDTKRLAQMIPQDTITSWVIKDCTDRQKAYKPTPPLDETAVERIVRRILAERESGLADSVAAELHRMWNRPFDSLQILGNISPTVILPMDSIWGNGIAHWMPDLPPVEPAPIYGPWPCRWIPLERIVSVACPDENKKIYEIRNGVPTISEFRGWHCAVLHTAIVHDSLWYCGPPDGEVEE